MSTKDEIHVHESERKVYYKTARKEYLTDQIIDLEWEAFDQVENEGGRAQCQDDWDTFFVMRKSQYMTWTVELLESYREDLRKAKAIGWNLMTEKYGRMMEDTDPEKYASMERYFPKIAVDKKVIIEEIIKIQVRWMEEFTEKYPYLAANSRSVYTFQDEYNSTSFETYLRGELSTYSDQTLKLYGGLIVEYLREEKNLTTDIMTNIVNLYGYEKLRDAEKFLKKSSFEK